MANRFQRTQVQVTHFHHIVPSAANNIGCEHKRRVLMYVKLEQLNQVIATAKRNNTFGDYNTIKILSKFSQVLFICKQEPGLAEVLNCIHEAEWTPFQTHYFSENLVAPRIETGPRIRP
jgi:hypothetical protein